MLLALGVLKMLNRRELLRMAPGFATALSVRAFGPADAFRALVIKLSRIGCERLESKMISDLFEELARSRSSIFNYNFKIPARIKKMAIPRFCTRRTSLCPLHVQRGSWGRHCLYN